VRPGLQEPRSPRPQAGDRGARARGVVADAGQDRGGAASRSPRLALTIAAPCSWRCCASMPSGCSRTAATGRGYAAAMRFSDCRGPDARGRSGAGRLAAQLSDRDRTGTGDSKRIAVVAILCITRHIARKSDFCCLLTVPCPLSLPQQSGCSATARRRSCRGRRASGVPISGTRDAERDHDQRAAPRSRRRTAARTGRHGHHDAGRPHAIANRLRSTALMLSPRVTVSTLRRPSSAARTPPPRTHQREDRAHGAADAEERDIVAQPGCSLIGKNTCTADPRGPDQEHTISIRANHHQVANARCSSARSGAAREPCALELAADA